MIGLLVAVPSAEAYDERVHQLLSTRSYPGKAGGPEQPADRPVPTSETAPALGPLGSPPAPEGERAAASPAEALRIQVYRAGASASDAALQRRFLTRYPTQASFDSWAWKRFLALNPDKTVSGLDAATLPAELDGRALYAQASRWPDEDQRNRDRFRHGPDRRVLHDPWDRPLPEDPATLEMGGLSGLSSQAHAHYGLPELSFSDDPEVLKTDPRRFAVPPTVHTFGGDFAETYTALAVLASQLPDGDRLALALAGAAAHHLEDLANQIHTVQVGLYDFFVDAKLESIKEELRSVGGLARPRSSFMEIGIGIIRNHHVLAEALFARHLLAPGDPVAALLDDTPADPAFAGDLSALGSGCAPGFGRKIARALIERSSHEGAPVYAAIRTIAQRRWSRAGVRFEEGEDPELAIRPGADRSSFYALQARGARRALQTLEAWWAHFSSCAADGQLAGAFAIALVRDRLDALDAAEARARAWSPRTPEKESVTWWVPIGYLLLLTATVVAVRRACRRA